MGTQHNFKADFESSYSMDGSARRHETVNYITDLLGELHSIANISGLADLSDDIQSVLSKHVTRAF